MDILNGKKDALNPVEDILNQKKGVLNPVEDILNEKKDVLNPVEEVLNVVEDVPNGLWESVAKGAGAELSGEVNQDNPCGHDRLKYPDRTALLRLTTLLGRFVCVKKFTVFLFTILTLNARADLVTHRWTVGRDPHEFGLVGDAAGDGSDPHTHICLGDALMHSWTVHLHIYWVVTIANLPILLGLAFYCFRRYRRRHANAA